MMSPGELRALAGSFRANPARQTDDELVERIESDVEDYRALLADRPEQLPYAPLNALLPLMGWLIYESSWESVQRMTTGFDRFDAEDERRVRSEMAMEHVNRLADAARRLPWPEFAPRALGAIRSQALAESKRDTKSGYDAAWLVHEEGRRRYHTYRDSHGSSPDREVYVQGLDEVLVQLALAETGTACRTAERVIGRWAEDYAELAAPGQSRTEAEEAWVQRMFIRLTQGVDVGELAIETAAQIRTKYGLADEVSEKRLTMRTARQNPGIMTARAALLLLGLRHEMERLGRLQPAGFATWQEWEEDLLKRRFTRAYRSIENREGVPDGAPVIVRADYLRQYVHLRLILGLLKPGYNLPAELDFAPCLALNPIDDVAVEALSRWLTEESGKGNWRGFGAATMPSFIRSVITCREQGSNDEGYQRWRRTWFEFEAYAREDGRKERVEAALAEAASQEG